MAVLPLQILPAEIWEMIILNVKDSEDLRSLMKASKQLNNAFIKIQHLWLLDKVLPILVPTTMPKLKHYLEEKDLKNLRLVDKRWSRSVNAFLKNQPKLRPYNKSDDKLNSEEYIWPESCIGYYSDLWDDPELGRVTFSSYSKLSKFRRTFRNSKRNPFPARSVFGKTQPDYTVYSPLEDEEKLEFWGEMDKEVFQKHGKHIWFLKMTWDRFYFQLYPYPSRANSIWKWIVNSLSSLPNLKGLHLEFKDLLVGKSNMSMSNSEAKEYLELEKNQLPQMRFLESLKITRADVLPELFSYKLLSKYSTQLRRLRISIVCLKTRQNWTFPNLTELHIDEINTDDNVMQVLTSLETLLLKKLQFNCSESLSGDCNPLAIDILSLFPSLLHLNMPCLGFDIRESETRGPRDSNHSLKYLKIGKPIGVKYNFLSYLPNLQQLHVCSNTGVNKLFSKRRVWELCPKLRTLLETEHCSRKHYKMWAWV